MNTVARSPERLEPRLDEVAMRPSGSATSRVDATELRRQLKWLLAIRLVVVGSVALLYFLLSLIPADPLRALDPRFVFLLAGSISLASLVYLGMLRFLPGREPLHAYIQFTGDLLLITVLVFWFGGGVSPFSMLYLIVISIAAALLRRRAAILVANIAYVMYASVALALHFGWISSPSQFTIDDTTLLRLVYSLATHLLGFYGVALLTSYLAINVTRAERELEEKTVDLADLRIVYQDVVQSMSSGLVTTDLAGAVTSVNRLGENLLGHPAEDLVGRHVVETGLVDDTDWEALTVAVDDPARARHEVDVEREDETLRFGYTATPFNDAYGQRLGHIIVFQDLTEVHKLEQEVQIKERMAAIGELAAGIAHEIGNPLAAISGSVQMLIPSEAEDSSRKKLLEIILRESRRLDRAVKGFLQFARPAERSSVRFDIGVLLAEHVELLRNSEEVTAEHRVELDLEPPRTTILADPDQVSQVFWNLTRNALRAMNEGGTLAVRGRATETVYRLTIVDTGRGMTTAEQARLFHPFKSFFDEGTGIGMAIVYRIVEEHGGRVSIDSSPGVGTAITIELPISTAVVDADRRETVA